jgi:hypothetical protein
MLPNDGDLQRYVSVAALANYCDHIDLPLASQLRRWNLHIGRGFTFDGYRTSWTMLIAEAPATLGRVLNPHRYKLLQWLAVNPTPLGVSYVNARVLQPPPGPIPGFSLGPSPVVPTHWPPWGLAINAADTRAARIIARTPGALPVTPILQEAGPPGGAFEAQRTVLIGLVATYRLNPDGVVMLQEWAERVREDSDWLFPDRSLALKSQIIEILEAILDYVESEVRWMYTLPALAGITITAHRTVRRARIITRKNHAAKMIRAILDNTYRVIYSGSGGLGAVRTLMDTPEYRHWRRKLFTTRPKGRGLRSLSSLFAQLEQPSRRTLRATS